MTRRESACCSFSSFTFITETDTLLLNVEVPAAHVVVLGALAARAAAGTRQGADCAAVRSPLRPG
ncbi:hypothetical protein Ait01nite_097120 [Actinoplanes italicus]|nr:hypothetical protein Ait01nite_097120 [Actinoplanes italicus]